jgi:hypothetical protein
VTYELIALTPETGYKQTAMDLPLRLQSVFLTSRAWKVLGCFCYPFGGGALEVCMYIKIYFNFERFLFSMFTGIEKKKNSSFFLLISKQLKDFQVFITY